MGVTDIFNPYFHGLKFIHSLKLTASSPLNIGRLPQKEKKIFQPLIFRGENVSFREGKWVEPWGYLFHPTFLLALVWGSPFITGFSGPTLNLTQTLAQISQPKSSELVFSKKQDEKTTPKNTSLPWFYPGTIPPEVFTVFYVFWGPNDTEPQEVGLNV